MLASPSDRLKRGTELARKRVIQIYSDLSGEEVPEERAVKITLDLAGKKFRLDVADHEIQDLIDKAKPLRARSRRARGEATG